MANLLENWVLIMLYLENQADLRLVLLAFVETIEDLQSQHRAECWHFECVNKLGQPRGISFRVYARPETREEVRKILETRAQALCANLMIPAYTTDLGKQAWFTVPPGADWPAKAACLWRLSEIVVRMLRIDSQRERTTFFHETVLHHLFNMIDGQHLFHEYPVKRGFEVQLAGMMGPPFDKMLAWRIVEYQDWLQKGPLKISAYFGDVP